MAQSERDRSKRSRSLKTVGQLGSLRSSLTKPEQLRGPRARILQGRAPWRYDMRAPLFVGMDVSQSQLDVALRPGNTFAVAHDEAGIAEIVGKLEVIQPTLIVFEASGGLEVPLTGALAAKGLPVVAMNPR